MKCSFRVVQEDADRVFIVDLDLGMSVTNDAEAVREYIGEKYPGKRLIYRDTVGCWDEIVSDVEGLFKPYREYLPEE